jgi:hypothetical protein
MLTEGSRGLPSTHTTSPATTSVSRWCRGRVELGDEIAVDGHSWPVEVVDIVWAPPRAQVAPLVKVRPVVLHPV